MERMRTRLISTSLAVLFAFTLSFAAAPDAAKRGLQTAFGGVPPCDVCGELAG